MTTCPTLPHAKSYRLPPYRHDHYVVMRRGEVSFCLHANEVSEVGRLEHVPPGSRLMDPCEILANCFPASTPQHYILCRSKPAHYLVFDELCHLRATGESMCRSTESPSPQELIKIGDQAVPQIDPTLLRCNVKLEDILRPITQLQGHSISQEPAEDNTCLYDMCVVGGLGHVGLPLGLCFANAGKRVVLYDINRQSVEQVRQGHMPFKENGAQDVLERVLDKKLHLSTDKSVISQSYFVVIVIGTPVDEHLNPQFSSFMQHMADIAECLHNGQHLILRSTLYPGTTEKLKHSLESTGKHLKISFCPERIAQGYAMEELQQLPQIVSSCDEQGLKEATELFRLITNDIQVLDCGGAELAKLFCNVWRYIQFSTSNQFYQIAVQHDMDFYRILKALKWKYPRLAGMPSAGFAAGPCLFKDTMQLAAFTNNNFFLGHAAMLVNEGLPNFIADRLKQKYPVRELTVGILGMAFKPDNDDKRDSLSYKLKNIFEIEAANVICTDVYIQNEHFIGAEELVERSDIIIVATPHSEYRDLVINKNKILVDLWNFFGKGGQF